MMSGGHTEQAEAVKTGANQGNVVDMELGGE